MCWFSAEHANKIEQAKAGQRLGIKNMNWRWFGKPSSKPHALARFA